MATKEFQASWVDVYNKSGGWSKKHSSHPINAGYNSEWHSIIRIPDAVREALKSSSTSTTLEMRIYVTNSPSEIDIGYANHSSSRSTGASGLPQYTFTESWHSVGSGWQTYGMSNFFKPRVEDGRTKNIVLYSYQGAHSFQATGIGWSNYVRFRVTGTWEPPKTTSKVSISGGSATMGSTSDKLGVRLDRSNNSLIHTIQYAFGHKSGTIASKTSSTSVGWTVPLSLANQITNGSSRSGTITAITYDGSREIGRSSTSFTAVVPNNSSTRPSISNYKVSINGSGQDSVIGKYVQGITRPKVSFSGSGKYGASISSYRIRYEGQSYNTNNAVLNRIKNAGTQTVELRVTDSRGFTTVSNQSLTSVGYNQPSVSAFDVRRTSGSTVAIKRSGSFTSFGGQNSVEIRIYSRLSENTSWGSPVATGSSSSGSFNAEVSESGYDESFSYQFRLEVEDEFGNVATGETSIGTAFQPLTIHPLKGVGVGKIYEENIGGALQVGGESFFDGGLDVAGESNIYGTMTLHNTGVFPYTTGTTLDKEGVDYVKGLTMEDLGNNSDFPVGKYGHLVNFKTSEYRHLQFVSKKDYPLYYRNFHASSGWETFKQIETVETGSNSNGRYIKFSDGIMICINTEMSEAGNAFSHQEGSLYRASSVTWYYPHEFVGSKVFATAETSDWTHWCSTYYTDRNDYCRVIEWSSTSNNSPHEFRRLFAIGRWK